MAHLGSRRGRALALPVGLALTASLGFLAPGAASAAELSDAPATVAAFSGPKLSYVVNIEGGRWTAASVRKAIAAAGGEVVISYDQIGVIVVHSQNPEFAKTIRQADGVVSAGSTRTAPLSAQSDDSVDEGAQALTPAEAKAAAAAAADGQDPLEPLQWDMPAIKADKAHAKTLGSSKVTVGIIDTGVDDTHPDLAPNFDAAASANCVSGKPDTTPGSWRPMKGESDHGTHVAGTIGAAKNGIGITGVAPGVKLAGIKVSTPDGFFYTEAVVCGFVWAAEHGVDVTNNSYYTDPWMFACKNDEDQKALIEAVTRATRYAEKKGTVNVAAAGNSKFDLAADTITDTTSPNDTTAVTRDVDPTECFDYPSMLPGVVTVSATGAKNLKSSYSNYGLGVIDVAAPGGDRTEYQTPDAPAVNGRILSTTVDGGYNYKAGTSMASPHAAGVLALLKSTHPNASPAALKALLYAQADDLACTNPYDIEGDGKIDAVCEGGKNKNGFYGAGLIDALAAVK
ncbi:MULTISPECIES: S8 family peptidase [Streptomyces]|jgi:subtilisin family serine protease|uniref:Subtilisin family serine protease n=1 Tax=Streptomyces nymphaeiformis TaxID=2663842 RepID=A0A7W7TVT5_9ACTN|nr:S8 family serine peptidase [Streptomyces nymphaeiformis]MBB4980279.1 subtilisin family serine protease [Streptomyces nymphaeiformis]